MPRAVVLLSGGIDSSTALAIARSEGFETHALTVRYGQRHAHELAAAEAIARWAGCSGRLVIDVDLRGIGGSALTADLAVPKGRSASEMSSGIPVTYVPARNTLFLALALGWAEVLSAEDIFLGVNALDYSGYPDCRPEFVEAFERLANLATRAGVEGKASFHVRTPLLRLAKAEIVRRGAALGVPFHLTHSCYDPAPDGAACGACDSCELRRKGFREAGVPDPTRYRETS